MRHRLRILLALSLAATLVGCLGGGPATLASLGPDAEAVTAMGDGLVGQIRGVKLSRDARAKALDTEYQALQFAPAGQAVNWTADGYEGTVVPTQLYRVGSQDCRGYSHLLVARGKSTKAVGTACRTEDGLWKPVA